MALDPDWKYITPEDYAEAAGNGISKRTLDARKKYGWDRKRAVNQTVKKGKPSRINKRKKPLKFTQERLMLMEKYGITRRTAQRRYHKYNWDIEEVFINRPQLNHVTAKIKDNRKKEGEKNEKRTKYS